jgi:hypothetical protein
LQPTNPCPTAKTQDDKDLLDAYNKSKKKKTRWKKPGEEDDTSVSKKTEVDKRRFHFPVIRGLQFCPETCKYVDRDMKASLTIARLAVMRIVRNERPRAFVKGTKYSIAGEGASASTHVDGITSTTEA